MRLIKYVYGWVFVRPRRWFFRKMICNTQPIWLPRKAEWRNKIDWPNIHWWLLYKTVFKFCKWLYWDAWCKFCTYENGFLSKKPLIAKIIHRIGSTTAGSAISGGECYHCASPEGCQVELSDDETGVTFILEGTQAVPTQDGTDHQFWGTTICPKCGYKSKYSDGSL